MISFTFNGYPLRVMQYGEGIFEKDMAGHSHGPFSYELHNILGGKGTLCTDTQEFSLRRGDFFLTGPGVWHRQTTVPADPMREVYVYLQGDATKSKDAVVSAFLSNPFYFGSRPEFEPLFSGILREKAEKKPGYPTVVVALLQIVLTEFSRALLPEYLHGSEDNSDLNDRRYLIVESAFLYDPAGVTLSSLAEAVGLSERQTQRLLLKYYGKSFSEKKKEALTRRF